MDNYRKIKVIGKGSFGKAVLVHLATDKKAIFVMKVALSKKILISNAKDYRIDKNGQARAEQCHK